MRLIEDLGIGWRYVVNGLIGGIIWSLYRKSKFFEAVRQILIGAIVSGYITPLLVEKTGIDGQVSLIASTSFAIGMTGMVIVDGVYKFVSVTVRDKVKNFKDAWTMILSKPQTEEVKPDEDDNETQ